MTQIIGISLILNPKLQKLNAVHNIQLEGTKSLVKKQQLQSPHLKQLYKVLTISSSLQNQNLIFIVYVYDFDIHRIDSWDFGEQFQVYADQNLVYNFEFMDNIATTDLCGLEDFNDQIHDIQFEFDHNGLTSYLYLTSTLDQENTDESWGFRNFRLFLYLCPSGCFVCSTNDLQTDCIVWMPIDSSYTETMPEEFSENGWIIENGLSTQQLCNQIPIICGFDVCGKDTTLTLNLEQLPLHRKMKLKLKYNYLRRFYHIQSLIVGNPVITQY